MVSDDESSAFVTEGQGLKDVSEIMKFPGEKHEGVWFQGWIFHNLLVFSRSAP